MTAIDEMLALFKGELSLDDILYGMPKKRLFELRDIRYNRLVDEVKSQERMMAENERQNIRNSILKK